MNAQIDCIRAIAIAFLAVTRQTTSRIDFLSRGKGSLIDGNWILLLGFERWGIPPFPRIHFLCADHAQTQVNRWQKKERKTIAARHDRRPPKRGLISSVGHAEVSHHLPMLERDDTAGDQGKVTESLLFAGTTLLHESRSNR